jgi:hypothetical protein
MKLKYLFFAVLSGMFVAASTSCSKEEIIEVDLSQPQGAFTSSKSGSIVGQSDTGSKGAVNLGKDSKNTSFLKFGSDFTTVLATGTVSVYLSTSQNYVADPGAGNPNLKLVGIVQKNGEQYFKMTSEPEAKFNHVILWCGSAGVPFGYAKLQ